MSPSNPSPPSGTTMTAPPPAAPAFPPATGQWGTTAVPVAPTKKKPGLIIGAAVAGVAVLGGAFALLNLTKDEPAPTTDPNIGPDVIDPGPTPPTLPVVTVPGPQPPPTVVTTTVPPAPTTTVPPAPPVPPTNAEPVFDRVAVGVPSGWDVARSESGFVLLVTDGAELRVVAGRADADAETLVRDWVSDPGGLESYEVTSTTPLEQPSSSIVSAYGATFQAVLATQQGSLPVEGMVFGYVTQDGIGVLLETFNAVGDFDSFVEDYRAMLRSVVDTL